MSPDAPCVNPTWLAWVAGVRACAHTVKTRESVAKSRKSVNEKNARLAWRNAHTTPCGLSKWKGRVELYGPR